MTSEITYQKIVMQWCDYFILNLRFRVQVFNTKKIMLGELFPHESYSV